MLGLRKMSNNTWAPLRFEKKVFRQLKASKNAKSKKNSENFPRNFHWKKVAKKNAKVEPWRSQTAGNTNNSNLFFDENENCCKNNTVQEKPRSTLALQT